MYVLIVCAYVEVHMCPNGCAQWIQMQAYEAPRMLLWCAVKQWVLYG